MNRGPAMSKAAAAVITVISFPMGPGLVVVLVPWLITRWQTSGHYPTEVQALGIALIAAGGILMVATFVRFPAEGSGVPFPTDPPSSQRVIVGGPYRYVRNPMYVSFIPAIIGQALLFGRPVLVLYTAVLIAALMAFVHWYEEPTLVKRFGDQYETYRRQVPGWWPRIARHVRDSHVDATDGE